MENTLKIQNILTFRYGGAFLGAIPAGNYMFKVNNRNIKTRCETCSKLTTSIVNFEQINAGWHVQCN